MWITYKVVVANNSSTVAANVTEVANYYDADYELNPEDGFRVWSDTGDLPYANQSKYGSTYTQGGYNSLYVSGLGTLEPGQSQTYYITYKLSQEALNEVLTNNQELEHVVEISAYNTQYSSQTFYHTGTGSRSGQYASIDQDSAPENSQIGNRETYEDDTAMAPTLTVSLTTENRGLKGTVFKDSEATEVNGEKVPESERLGDGIYNLGEDGKVENVKVELIEMENGQVVKDSNGNDKIASTYDKDNGEQHAETTTDANGNYSIAGLIPDEYILKYTYSDDSVVYSATGAQEGNIAVNDYKATIITSDVIKQALNNNNNVVKDPDAELTTQINYGEPYDADKWHIIKEETETEPKEIIRYSDAMDTDAIVTDAITPVRINNESYKDVGNGKTAYEGITAKQAYTGAINVQVEYDADEKVSETEEDKKDTTTEMIMIENPDGTYALAKELRQTIENVDFGIIEKPKKNYSTLKQVAYIKLTLANGQILIEGDPRTDKLDYVKMLDDPGNPGPFNRVNMEVDNELLYGSTLEITYEIFVTNESETNYLTKAYYKYGTERENVETITVSKIIDYLDSQLVPNLEGVDPNSVRILEETDHTTHHTNGGIDGLLIEDAAEFAKNHTPVILITSDAELLPKAYLEENPDVTGECQENYEFKAQKLLSTSDDLDFSNDMEVIEVVTTPAPPDGSTPGNYYFEQDEHGNMNRINIEVDNAYAELIITPPTGANKTHIITIVAIVASALLAGGIVLIKRKFFKNK